MELRARAEHMAAKAAEMGTRVADPQSDDRATANAWSAELGERLAAAEVIASTLSGEPLKRQRRRIASVKRNPALGAVGLKAADSRLPPNTNWATHNMLVESS